MNAVYLTRIDPEKNMARFYKLDVQPDLFGNWSLIREWGRIGRPGTVRMKSCQTEGEALVDCERQQQLKEGRGYSSWQPTRPLPD